MNAFTLKLLLICTNCERFPKQLVTQKPPPPTFLAFNIATHTINRIKIRVNHYDFTSWTACPKS